MTAPTPDYDYIIIGGGFYGCCLALYLRSISKRILLVEASAELLSRASRVNQARVHTGFHYPRSTVTAVKSMMLHRRFLKDFPDAVFDEFEMIYAIARHNSKVTAKKFHRMFRDMNAPIEPASPNQAALLDPDMIEAAFSCYEVAFDYSILKQQMSERLEVHGIDVRLSTEVSELEAHSHHVQVGLSDGTEVTAQYAFNITYSQINAVLEKANLPTAHLKHELAEIALVEPPEELREAGITVMDGPFFSCMPYPSENLYSLTHVRYTPHDSWLDDARARDPYSYFAGSSLDTRYPYMLRDAQRFMPCLQGASYKKSIYDVKTILIKNEGDDGRPILYQQKPKDSRVISILGGKIDNIYDLFDLIRTTSPKFASANTKYVLGSHG